MKSLLLAAATFFCVYMTLVLAAYFFKVDFRFFTLSIKTIDPLRLGMLLRYAPFFAVFYVINSLTLNASVAVSGKKEWVNTLLCALENVGGLLVIHIVDYAGMFTSGTKLLNGYSSMGGNSALAGILLWGLLLVLPLAAIIARRLYKKTGNFWLSGRAAVSSRGWHRPSFRRREVQVFRAIWHSQVEAAHSPRKSGRATMAR